MKYKYFLVGDADTVLAFRSIGVEGIVAETRQEALAALAAAPAREAGVLMITEEVAQMVREEVDLLRFEQATPMVVEIPGPQGPLPGRRALADIIRAAIGVKV